MVDALVKPHVEIRKLGWISRVPISNFKAVTRDIIQIFVGFENRRAPLGKKQRKRGLAMLYSYVLAERSYRSHDALSI